MTENQEPYEIKVKDHRIPETKEVVVQEGPYAVVMMAMQKGYTPELIEKMMGLQERFEANEARKSFYDAKAAFKAEAPVVKKDKDNAQYKSRYASEDALFNTMNPVLSRHGLETCFEFPEVPEGRAVTCILTHRLGHSERVTLSGPLDVSGSKNPLQQVKSTVTYLRKATYEAILGIASGDKDSDDDGNGSAEAEFITEQQQADLVKLFQEKKFSDERIAKFFEYMKADDLETILAKDFGKAINALKKAKGE